MRRHIQGTAHSGPVTPQPGHRETPWSLHLGAGRSARASPSHLKTGFCKELSKPPGEAAQLDVQPYCAPGRGLASHRLAPVSGRSQGPETDKDGTGETWHIRGPQRPRLQALSFLFPASSGSEAPPAAPPRNRPIKRQKTARGPLPPARNRAECGDLLTWLESLLC